MLDIRENILLLKLTPLDLMEIWQYILIGIAAVAAGMVNALAGGGTLITFPVLTAMGLPAVVANITNTVALCPGYLGGSYAQRKDLKGQGKHLWILIPAAILGGAGGGILLFITEEKLFRGIVPWLILLAAALLAMQGMVRNWLKRRNEKKKSGGSQLFWSLLLVIPATVYGGYFGAGLGVILLSVLGLTLNDDLIRLNALKQTLSLSANLAAALFFVFSGRVDWTVAVVMAIGALCGGFIGGKLAGKIKPEVLRWTVVGIGVVVSIILAITL
jgi:uncharacterized protein